MFTDGFLGHQTPKNLGVAGEWYEFAPQPPTLGRANSWSPERVEWSAKKPRSQVGAVPPWLPRAQGRHGGLALQRISDSFNEMGFLSQP
jgi:hypothetical protein